MYLCDRYPELIAPPSPCSNFLSIYAWSLVVSDTPQGSCSDCQCSFQFLRRASNFVFIFAAIEAAHCRRRVPVRFLTTLSTAAVLTVSCHIIGVKRCHISVKRHVTPHLALTCHSLSWYYICQSLSVRTKGVAIYNGLWILIYFTNTPSHDLY